MMQKDRHSYYLEIQFLGFRYSGWQKQPGQKTIEGMLIKTLKFILPNRDIKILGAGRTDAKVSALQGAFQLFLQGDPLENTEEFLQIFNQNLPADIRVLAINKTAQNFNIIQDRKTKEYVYLFSNEKKNHPFAAPYMANFNEPLNLKQMQLGAKLFQGTHNFKAFTARPRENSRFTRTVRHCEIRENNLLTANFFPERSYMLVMKGDGFLRYQIRMIMGALFYLGKGEIDVVDITDALLGKESLKLTYVAPGSGLILNTLDFKY